MLWVSSLCVTFKRDRLQAKHPVVFVPGIVTGGLELWKGKPCVHDLFRKRLWGGTFGEIYKRYTILSKSCQTKLQVYSIQD